MNVLLQLESRLARLQDVEGELSGEVAVSLLDAMVEALPRPAAAAEERELWWRTLDLTARPRFLRSLGSDAARRRWAEAAFVIIEATGFSLRELFAQRVRSDRDRPLFRHAQEPHAPGWSYERTARYARALAAVFAGDVHERDDHRRVAILADNSLHSATSDLACLCHDIFVAPLNVHTDVETLGWMLERLAIDTVVTDTEERLLRLQRVRDGTGRAARIFVTDPDLADPGRHVFSLAAEVAGLVPDTIEERLEVTPRFGMREVCTVLFTSGSTGRPKGVAFTQLNLVTKRFARGAALPAAGNDEVFLCYLPFFHTFGRYLELLGSIYWHGTYTFAGNPSADTLLRQLPEVRPTALIGVPLRWKQLQERCLAEMGPAAAADHQREIVARITGGRLRWGLSAAGYLEPRVFRFFHHHGIELSSGFGMTEGTGGLTMTPPGDYLDDSVGVPLPGTRIRFAKNGELEIAGPYIARHLPEEGPPGDFTVERPDSDEHWLGTGDLFRQMERGHLRIVDRIKDIYKNNRGQTIAPARVESAFTGVAGIRRTFLVGDGRAYNTLLIVPELDETLSSISADELRQYFRRLIAQANLDLPPYERVVNFALLDRDFSQDRGELTAKGSYRRARIEKNFGTLIEELYRGTTELEWDGLRIVLPRWFYRDLGLLEGAIRADASGLVETVGGRRLTLARLAAPQRLRVGDLEYTLDDEVLDLGAFVRQPMHWAGNPELMEFGPCRNGWDTPLAAAEQVCLPSRDASDHRAARPLAPDAELRDLDLVFQRALYGPEAEALTAVNDLGQRLGGAGHPVGRLIRRRLEALATHPASAVRCRAYQVLLLDNPALDHSGFYAAFVQSGRSFLSPASIADIASTVEPRRLSALSSRMYNYRAQLEWPAPEGRRQIFEDLFQLFADFARFRPEFYGTVREELAQWIRHDADPALAASAERQLLALAAWFEEDLDSRWPSHLDPSGWEGLIEFQEGIGDHEIDRLRRALVGTTFLQESLALTHEGETLEFDELGPGGIWISLIRSTPRYSRYRLSINTRTGRHFDLQIVLPEDAHAPDTFAIIFWFLALRGYPHGRPVLPPFGCFRPNLGAFSLRYVSDLTVWERIREISARGGTAPPPGTWRRLLATAMATVVSGWLASGRRIVPGLVAPTNVMVPEPDYREDAVLVNLTEWQPYRGPASLVRPLLKNFFRQTAAHYPRVRDELRTTWIFEAIREALSPADARAFLHDLRASLVNDPLPEAGPDFPGLLDDHLAGLDHRYRPPLAVEAALDRYAEWARLNRDATMDARLSIVDELRRLYRIDGRGEIARYHLFQHTCFEDAPAPIHEALDRIINCLHRNPGRRATELVELSDLQDLLAAAGEHAAFQRVAFPAFEPQKDLWLVTVGDRERHHVVLRSRIADRRGGIYTVHDPVAPAEMGVIYRMFFLSGYPKTVSEHDHILVVENDRDHVVGGVCYQLEEDGVVHMDGIVVTRALHGRGLTTAILEDFAVRMTDAGHRVLRTHYVLPEFFQKRGFRLDHRWGGLVRFLQRGTQ